MRLSLNTLLVLGCLSVGCGIAQGRIGETEKQCEERYGKPTPMTGDRLQQMYRKGEFIIVAHFHEGKCDYITFSKPKVEILGIRPIFDYERDALLKANGGDKEWVKKTDEPYKTTDGKLYAYLEILQGTLMIITPEADKRRLDAIKAEEEKKMKGF